MKLEKNDVIMFNGDSTTDCSRNRNDEFSLSGYSKIVAQTLDLYKSELNLKIYNRGISGNTTADVVARLEKELIEIKPTVFSILIGINDTWRRYDSNKITNIDVFEDNFKQILTIASKYVKRIIVIEPFLLNSDPNKAIFREDLDPKINVERKIAAQFKTEYIPLDGIFAEKSTKVPPSFYSEDGVHPSINGHAVIAQNILSRIC